MNKIPKIFVLKFLVVFAASTLFVGGFGFAVAYYLNEIPKWTNLINNGRVTTAKIEKIDNDSRGTIYFSYQLDGRKYTGLAYLYFAGYKQGELQTGQEIKIIYDPKEPEKGYFLDLDDKLDSAYFQVWFAAIGLPILAVWFPFIAYAIFYVFFSRPIQA